MSSNSENNSASNPVINEFSLVVTAIKIVVLAIFLLPIAKYTFISKQDNENNATVLLENINATMENAVVEEQSTKNEESKVDVIKRVIIPQPACPKSDILIVLDEICNDIVFNYRFCSPKDVNDPRKHKIPKYLAKNKSNKDAKGKRIN